MMPSVLLIWRADQHRIGIVEWDDPTAHHWSAERVLPLAGFPDRRDFLQVGQDVFDHARPDVVADPPRGDVDHANRLFDEFQLRQLCNKAAITIACIDAPWRSPINDINRLAIGLTNRVRRPALTPGSWLTQRDTSKPIACNLTLMSASARAGGIE
jgi:hypothetical protein